MHVTEVQQLQVENDQDSTQRCVATHGGTQMSEGILKETVDTQSSKGKTLLGTYCNCITILFRKIDYERLGIVNALAF